MAKYVVVFKRGGVVRQLPDKHDNSVVAIVKALHVQEALDNLTKPGESRWTHTVEMVDDK